MLIKRILVVLLTLAGLAVLAVAGIETIRSKRGDQPSTAVADPRAQIEHGRYLARAGNCMACHTARGGAAYAGGRVIPTPFGNIYAPNITPDQKTGIGSWTAEDFWRSIHLGRSKDGSFLYPAFPYTSYTKVTRADSDAMFAYLRTVQPIEQDNRPSELRFPFNQRWLLPVWRTLYFQPGVYEENRQQSVEWNRGAYLVQGLGHCNACHTNRNALGATQGDLAGGMIPILNWYAPSLTSDKEAGLGNWELEHISDLLKTGVSVRSNVYGPMAEVVRQSLQHLSDSDIRAMAVYLKSLPQRGDPSHPAPARVTKVQAEALQKQGAQLYEKHCVECHKADGRGAPTAYPPLAGNRSVVADLPINPIRMVLNGGYPPSTQGNPRPYGMPPFGHALSDAEVAALVSYIRNAWGNQAASITPDEVARYRAVPVE